MLNVLTSEKVRSAEEETMRRGVDVMFLRFNAALAVADGIYERARGKNTRTAVFCGSGGNGCDGILAAVRLFRKGCNVVVYLVGSAEKANAQALEYAKSEGVPVRPCSEFDGADIIIDAIFGIGLNRPIEGETAELIEKLNGAENAFRLAVDIPSGLNADTGEVMGKAFKAHVTITFSCYKAGMLFGEGREYCGKITVEDVGVKTESNVRVYENSDFAPFRRRRDAHKGNAGRVYIIGGCGSMIGAPVLAATAAHAAHLNGAGTVTVCLPSVHRVAVSSRSAMSMMKFLSDTANGYIKFVKRELDDIIKRADAIAIGMGMGAAPDLKRMIAYLCENFDGSLVIDADAINALAGDYSILRGSKPEIVLTPHVGEFKRLTGLDPTIENAAKLARDVGCLVALKSATTIITDGEETRLNVTGTPAMAKGGMGDVLSGCITALSCAYPLFDAITVACYRNGVGAERAVSSFAEMMLTAHDVLNMANYPEL
ncbi:MAG: NAD(P)H-hydrate dehydratase [Roseburia sp.]|nr:NAD(P)H-hydrate dehydratase [Roseburia sp.]